MKKLATILMIIAVFGTMSLVVKAQELIKGAGENAYVANGVAVRFPSGWKPETDGKQNFVRAATADGSSKLILYVTANDNFDSVKEQVLDKYLAEYTNVESVGQDNLERDGLGLRTDTFKAKSNNSNYTITAQFAFVLGVESVKTVLLVSAVRDNAAGTYLSAVREVFAGEKTASKTTASVEPKTDSTGGRRVWNLIVESREDIGETAAEFKADLKKAFEDAGDTVAEKASDDSIDLYFYLGKDDADDDNDGMLDDKDVGDANGDGAVNEQDTVDVIDLDREIPAVMDKFADKDKSAGIYIYFKKETGLALVFVTKADSFKESSASASVTLPGNGFFQNASFAPSNRQRGGSRESVAKGIVADLPHSTSTKLGVANFKIYPDDERMTTEKLEEKFAKFGTVINGVNIDYDSIGIKKRVAALRMSADDAVKAIKGLNNKDIDNQLLQVYEIRELPAGTPAKSSDRQPSKNSYQGATGSRYN